MGTIRIRPRRNRVSTSFLVDDGLPWNYSDSLEILDNLLEQNIIIYGGDVLKICVAKGADISWPVNVNNISPILEIK